MPQPEPQKEHHWLDRLVGEWTLEMEAEGAPGEPPIRDTGTASVRTLGGLWFLSEEGGVMPDGTQAVSLMTLGYDPARQRYVGTFLGSMMTNLWIYEGTLDDAGRVLTLDTEGPSYTDEGTMARYRDTVEFLDDDHRVHTSSYQRPDGTWHRFMEVHYRRAPRS